MYSFAMFTDPVLPWRFQRLDIWGTGAHYDSVIALGRDDKAYVQNPKHVSTFKNPQVLTVLKALF